MSQQSIHSNGEQQTKANFRQWQVFDKASSYELGIASHHFMSKRNKW